MTWLYLLIALLTFYVACGVYVGINRYQREMEWWCNHIVAREYAYNDASDIPFAKERFDAIVLGIVWPGYLTVRYFTTISKARKRVKVQYYNKRINEIKAEKIERRP